MMLIFKILAGLVLFNLIVFLGALALVWIDDE